MYDEQVTLISNAKSVQIDKRNSPNAFETILASPLVLPGTWGVTLRDISYPHEWFTPRENFHYAILFPTTNREYAAEVILHDTQPKQRSDSNLTAPSNLPSYPINLRNLYWDSDDINFRDIHSRYNVRLATIPEGEHTDVNTIVNHISTNLQEMYLERFGAAPTDFVTFDTLKRRVTFHNLHVSRYIIVTPSKNSLITILGYYARAKRIQTFSERLIDVLVVEPNDIAIGRTTAVRRKNRQPPLPSTNPINMHVQMLDNVLVYSDIVEQSRVGDSLANYLGFFPIKSLYGQTGYWSFNHPHYVKVKFDTIRSISIKLLSDDGLPFPITTGKVIVGLEFHRFK